MQVAINGTLLALGWWVGWERSTLGELVNELYAIHFAAWYSLEIDWPSLLSIDAIAAFLDDPYALIDTAWEHVSNIFDFIELTPAYLLQGSAALSSLNAVLACIKPLAALANNATSLVDGMRALLPSQADGKYAQLSEEPPLDVVNVRVELCTEELRDVDEDEANEAGDRAVARAQLELERQRADEEGDRAERGEAGDDVHIQQLEGLQSAQELLERALQHAKSAKSRVRAPLKKFNRRLSGRVSQLRKQGGRLLSLHACITSQAE